MRGKNHENYITEVELKEEDIQELEQDLIEIFTTQDTITIASFLEATQKKRHDKKKQKIHTPKLMYRERTPEEIVRLFDKLESK